ncbi:uncharacterized protein LOC131928436 [Physella acuta]|uniref:uncharacterized protein LOC131928436 n=1 Tax=Physella acuta TaxID=109671 RepID=UPI0027DCD1E3|nr:uncharacterized protein LOC131928436 [Physella acuta]
MTVNNSRVMFLPAGEETAATLAIFSYIFIPIFLFVAGLLLREVYLYCMNNDQIQHEKIFVRNTATAPILTTLPSNFRYAKYSHTEVRVESDVMSDSGSSLVSLPHLVTCRWFKKWFTQREELLVPVKDDPAIIGRGNILEQAAAAEPGDRVAHFFDIGHKCKFDFIV